MRADATVSELCGRLPAAAMMALGVSDHDLALPSGSRAAMSPCAARETRSRWRALAPSPPSRRSARR